MPPTPGQPNAKPGTSFSFPMPRIRVITFDLDNTLWDVVPVISGAERRMLQWLEEAVPEVLALYTDGGAVADIRDDLIEERPAIVHDVSSLREELTFRCIRRVGRDRESARSLARGAFNVFLEARHEIEFFDGALDALDRLSRNYTLGSLTNGNADPKRLQLDRFFSFSFSAATVGTGKPAPDMFERVLSHADIRADEAVHVGDHPIDDIQGAANVGMHTVWANGPKQRALRGAETAVAATVEIERLEDLDDAIRHIESL